MLNKIYAHIKKYIRENHNFLLFLILLVLVLNIKLPYIVERPGGITSLNSQIKINGKNIKGNYNSSYVKVNNGNVISLIMGFIIPKWEIVKLSEYTPDESVSYNDVLNYEKILMEQSHNFAIKNVFDKLQIPYSITKEKMYVHGDYENFNTLLKTNDLITKCDDQEINLYEDLTKCINKSEDNTIKLRVLRNKKEIDIDAPLHFYRGRKVIGVIVLRDFAINSNTKIEFINNSSESGPSAGFMTALALYDNLSKKNLIGNLKVAGTGTIDEEGNVGKIDGIKFKLLGANKKVDIYFVPEDSYKEAKKVLKKYKLKINIVSISTLDDAINYLENYNR